MIRILIALSALAAAGWLLSGAAILATGCTEPGTCAAPGELGRDANEPFFWTFVSLGAVTAALGAIRLVEMRRVRR